MSGPIEVHINFSHDPISFSLEQILTRGRFTDDVNIFGAPSKIYGEKETTEKTTEMLECITLEPLEDRFREIRSYNPNELELLQSSLDALTLEQFEKIFIELIKEKKQELIKAIFKNADLLTKIEITKVLMKLISKTTISENQKLRTLVENAKHNRAHVNEKIRRTKAHIDELKKQLIDLKNERKSELIKTSLNHQVEAYEERLSILKIKSKNLPQPLSLPDYALEMTLNELFDSKFSNLKINESEVMDLYFLWIADKIHLLNN